MVLKLRAYLGCALYRPENVLIMPNVAFEGAQSDMASKKVEVANVISEELTTLFKSGTPVMQWEPTTLQTYMTNTRNVEVEPISDLTSFARL